MKIEEFRSRLEELPLHPHIEWKEWLTCGAAGNGVIVKQFPDKPIKGRLIFAVVTVGAAVRLEGKIVGDEPDIELSEDDFLAICALFCQHDVLPVDEYKKVMKETAEREIQAAMKACNDMRRFKESVQAEVEKRCEETARLLWEGRKEMENERWNGALVNTRHAVCVIRRFEAAMKELFKLLCLEGT